MSPTQGALKERIGAALADGKLRRAVAKVTDAYREGKAKATATRPDWEAMREEARALRSHTIQHLDYYLKQLADRVRANGGHVHFAQTDQEAVEIVRRIARHHDVRRVVKSKSMISEEIHLNDALQEDGVEVVETDLGEYILQLAGETPSHIVGPSMHKSREDVAELFSAVEGQELTDDTPTLTAVARRRLRRAFLEADMGITGCNFAVAETGSVALVTNEGNGRMVTALPRVMVTLMGMERIVPRLEDLDLMVTMLTRSATGQAATSYLTITSGVRGPEEKDGPEAFHLVVVDNQRSSLLGGEFEEALNCIRCAACLNVCPVYRQIGGHAYGWVYSGPIGAVLTPLYKGMDEWGEVAEASSLCAACYEACPVKIPLHDMLVGIRRHNVERQSGGGHPSRWERWAFAAFGALMARPRLYRWGLKVGRWVQRPFVRNGHLRTAVPPLSRWQEGRELPALAQKSFRDLWAAGLADEPVMGGSAGLTDSAGPADHVTGRGHSPSGDASADAPQRRQA